MLSIHAHPWLVYFESCVDMTMHETEWNVEPPSNKLFNSSNVIKHVINILIHANNMIKLANNMAYFKLKY